MVTSTRAERATSATAFLLSDIFAVLVPGSVADSPAVGDRALGGASGRSPHVARTRTVGLVADESDTG